MGNNHCANGVAGIDCRACLRTVERGIKQALFFAFVFNELPLLTNVHIGPSISIIQSVPKGALFVSGIVITSGGSRTKAYTKMTLSVSLPLEVLGENIVWLLKKCSVYWQSNIQGYYK